MIYVLVSWSLNLTHFWRFKWCCRDQCRHQHNCLINTIASSTQLPHELIDDLSQEEEIKPRAVLEIFSKLRKSVSIMSRLWKDLPREIVEIVLACLPVHVLCRFRLVCKRWNHLITQPGFASLRAHAPRQASYVLISPSVLDVRPEKMTTRRNWEILDMAEQRFYTLSDSFIEDYMLHSPSHTECEHFGWDKHTLAADGGLIYAMYFGGRTQIWRHVVCNPVTKGFHHIPAPELRCSDKRAIVVMSVDNATQSYRIITMEARSRRPEVYLYDSTTAQWRKLCEVPDMHRAYSTIFLKGVFYTLFLDTSLVPWCPKLYSCDLDTGAWSYIDVELPQPSCLQDKSQLVVSLGRLFFVEYTGLPIFSSNRMTVWETLLASNPVKKKQMIKVSILEILLAEKEVIKVAEMPEYTKYPRRMLEEYPPQPVRGDAVAALGCGDCIVISSLFGRRVDFDLLKNCWHELPPNTGNMYESNRRGPCICHGIYTGLVTLDLREMREMSLRRIDNGLTS